MPDGNPQYRRSSLQNIRICRGEREERAVRPMVDSGTGTFDALLARPIGRSVRGAFGCCVEIASFTEGVTCDRVRAGDHLPNGLVRQSSDQTPRTVVWTGSQELAFEGDALSQGRDQILNVLLRQVVQGN